MKLDATQANALRLRAVILCVVTTTVVSALEITIGLLFGLLSVFAEGLHTLADLLDSLFALFLVAQANQPPDRDHPYGHGKFDALAALLEGTFVGLAAVWVMFKALQVIFGFTEAEPRPEMVTLLAMVGASVVYYLVSAKVLQIAGITRSPAVRAEAIHLRTHVYITLGLAAGLALSRIALAQQWPHAAKVDPVVTLLLGGYLLNMSYQIVSPALQQFLDRALPPEDLQKVIDSFEAFKDEFVEVHAVRTRQAGTEQHIDLHLIVLPATTVAVAHELSERIEDHLLDQLPAAHVLMHIEPASERELDAYNRRGQCGEVRTQHPAEPEASAVLPEEPPADPQPTGEQLG